MHHYKSLASSASDAAVNFLTSVILPDHNNSHINSSNHSNNSSNNSSHNHSSNNNLNHGNKALASLEHTSSSSSGKAQPSFSGHVDDDDDDDNDADGDNDGDDDGGRYHGEAVTTKKQGYNDQPSRGIGGGGQGRAQEQGQGQGQSHPEDRHLKKNVSSVSTPLRSSSSSSSTSLSSSLSVSSSSMNVPRRSIAEAKPTGKHANNNNNTPSSNTTTAATSSSSNITNVSNATGRIPPSVAIAQYARSLSRMLFEGGTGTGARALPAAQQVEAVELLEQLGSMLLLPTYPYSYHIFHQIHFLTPPTHPHCHDHCF